MNALWYYNHSTKHAITKNNDFWKNKGVNIKVADVAVLGFGVVGSGTVEVLEKNSDRIAQNAGQSVRVKYILDIRATRIRATSGF